MERENRKVLISFKISTLLLVILAIIIVSTVVNILINKVGNNTEDKIANSNIEIQKDINAKEDNNKESQNTERKITATISSRSSETRPTENTPNLKGGVGAITLDVEHSLEEEIEAEIELVEQTTPIEEVTISKDMDLTVRTGLSREDFITLISGVEEDKSGFFEENSGLIYDLCEKYQINEIFFCGLIAGESGWRIADNHRRTFNYISLMSGGKLIRYDSVEDGLETAAKTLHNNYLTEGGKFYYGPTLAGVKTRFCPASSTWTNLIYGNMKLILK